MIQMRRNRRGLYGNEVQTKPTNRKWKFLLRQNLLFAINIYLRLLGEAVHGIAFQNKLYVTQWIHKLNFNGKELLASICITLLMTCHRLPTWNASED